MFEELLARLKINPKELTSQLIVSARGIKELNNVYYRIEKQLQEPGFHQKRKYWSYDLIIKHSTKVALYSLALARAGNFTAKEGLRIAVAGLLHDVDKFYWPVELLDKLPTVHSGRVFHFKSFTFVSANVIIEPGGYVPDLSRFLPFT